MATPGRHPNFGPAEFEGRITRLKARMAEAKVDLALFDEVEAMTWLSGYGNSENRWRCVGIARDAEPFFLIRELDAGPCRTRSWITDVPTFRDWEDPYAVLAKAIAERGLSKARIGLDFNSYCMPLARFEKVKATLPGATFVDLGPVVWELRLIKSEAEIALLRKAAGVCDEAMRRAAAVCQPGVNQRKAAETAVTAFVALGADPGHPGPIAAGKGWDFLHAALEDAPLAKGDVVHIELVPRINGYCSRIMRCVSVGKPSAELAETSAKLHALHDKQIAAMVPGARAHDVDAILREGVIKERLRPSYDNITGYTLGLYAQMGPRTSDFTRIFHPGADWRIEAGQVFHMYCSANRVATSETVLITKNGPERLTKLDRGLIVNA